MLNIEFRKLSLQDYNSNFFELLNQLSECKKDSISFNDFNNFIKKLNSNHQIFIILDSENNKIIGTGTILIEEKLIHNLSKVAHVEDIVVDSNYRKNGIGKFLIDNLIHYAKNQNCYKIILDCQDKNIPFYQKCGFQQKGLQMAIYF